MARPPPRSTLLPCTTLCRSRERVHRHLRPLDELLDERLARARRRDRALHRAREHACFADGEDAVLALAVRRLDDAGEADEIGRAHGLNSSHANISYAAFCLK